MPESESVAPEQSRPAVRSLWLYSVAGSIGSKGVYFIALTGLAWVVSPERFGEFTAIYATVQVLLGTFGAASGLACNRRSAAVSASGGRPGRKDLRIAGTFGLAGGGLSSIAIPGGYFLLTGESSTTLLVLIGACVAFPVMLEALLGTFAGAGWYRTVAGVEIARGVMAGLLLFTFGTHSAESAVLGLLVADLIIVCGVAIPLMVNDSVISRRFPIRPHISLALTGVVANLVTQIAFWSVNLIIGRAYGLAELGAYAVANRFATFGLILPNALARNMLGHLARSAVLQRDKMWPEIRNYATASSALSLAAGLVAVAVSFWPAAGLFSKYPEARAMLFILVISFVPNAVSNALGVALVSLDLKRQWLVSDVMLSLSTVLSIVLLNLFVASSWLLLGALIIGKSVGAAWRLGTLLRMRQQLDVGGPSL